MPLLFAREERFIGKHASIIKQTLQRLDSKLAIGVSRYAVKQEARQAAAASGAPTPWAISDGQIHSWATYTAYKQHTLAFATWARAEHGVRTLADLDARRDELASAWLQQHIAAGASPYTLQAQRAALRLFFADRTLAAAVALPRRARAGITRSRHAAVRDRDLSQARHAGLIAFLRATGLRRSEVRDLRVDDIQRRGDRVTVWIRNGKGGKVRVILVLPGQERAVLAALEGRQAGQHAFERIPSHLDVHALRRQFAQDRYRQLSGRELPPATGRLPKDSYDQDAVREVSRALGHNRLDVVLRHYLR